MTSVHEGRGSRLGVRVAGRGLLMAALCVAAAASCAPSASAVIVQLNGGKRLSYEPLRGARRFSVTPFAGKNLVYHGGPVMTSNTNYTFYWQPSGAPEYAVGYQAGVDRYLENLAHDSGGRQNVDSVATQYTEAGGEAANYASHFGGRIVDTDPYPASGCTAAATCLTDAQIQAELTSYVKAHKLPADLAHEYFVLTPPGVESCFDAAGTECSAGSLSPAYCAYHGDISVSGGTIIYADDPYVVGVEGCDTAQHPSESPAEAALQGGLSHEHNESITDPELNAWFGPEGNEDGDKCRTFVEASEYGTPLGTAPDGAPYNQLIDGAEYWYQQEWSNLGSTCLQRLPAPTPTVSKLAPKKGTAAGGTSVTITGTGFTNVLAVKFAANAASFKVLSPTSIEATSPPGAVGAANVTVVAEAGTSPVTRKDRFKYTKK